MFGTPYSAYKDVFDHCLILHILFGTSRPSQAGATPKIVRLDEPWKWAEGAQMRAALGRLTKRSAVPSVWIGGEYVPTFYQRVRQPIYSFP